MDPVKTLTKQHVLTFRDVPAGYTAVCLICGVKFKDALEWLIIICKPKGEEHEGS